MEASRMTPRLPSCAPGWAGMPACHCNRKDLIGPGVTVGLGKGWGLRACFHSGQVEFEALQHIREKILGKCLDMCVWSSQKRSGRDVRVCRALCVSGAEATRWRIQRSRLQLHLPGLWAEGGRSVWICKQQRNVIQSNNPCPFCATVLPEWLERTAVNGLGFHTCSLVSVMSKNQ